MFQHSHVIFSCKCSTVLHLNFHCIHDCVTESHHKIYVNNLNIGIPWEQRLCTCKQYLKRKQKIKLKNKTWKRIKKKETNLPVSALSSCSLRVFLKTRGAESRILQDSAEHESRQVPEFHFDLQYIPISSKSNTLFPPLDQDVDVQYVLK